MVGHSLTESDPAQSIIHFHAARRVNVSASMSHMSPTVNLNWVQIAMHVLCSLVR